jgi:hypothetical protein
LDHDCDCAFHYTAKPIYFVQTLSFGTPINCHRNRSSFMPQLRSLHELIRISPQPATFVGADIYIELNTRDHAGRLSLLLV